MNREIKFRAWDKNIKKMLYSDRDFQNDLGEFFSEITDEKFGLLNLSKTLMQYTGLKIETGQEIYEGDILDSISSLSRKKSLVIWDECIFEGYYSVMGWTLKDEYDCNFNEKESKKYKIIGNIYENPNLINKIIK